MNLTIYSLYHFPIRSSRSDGEASIEVENHPLERNLVYITSGLVILFSLIAMGIYLLLIPATWKQFLNDYNFLFWMEWVAVWAFASAWLTKGRVIFAEIAIDLMSIPTERLMERMRSTKLAARLMEKP